jgi:outer membrane protein assembly factor BamB
MAPMSTPGGPRQQGSGDADRWAPFPVQDWSTMPSPAPGTDPYASVDPTWDPPGQPPRTPRSDPRPRWLPMLVVIMVTVLVAGGLLAAERVGAASGRSTATVYLPPDGQARFEQRDTTIGSQTTTSKHLIESAQQSGALVLGGLDWTLGSAVIGVVGMKHLDRMRFWRTTGTEIGNLGSSQQHVRVYRVDGAVELIAESDGGGADVYSPALVELPAQVSAGDSWSSEGKVGSRHYRSNFGASAAEPGCLEVRGTVVESTTSGQSGTTREVTKTWCEGRGVALEESVRGDVTTRVESISPPAADPTLRTADEEWSWSDPARWRRRDFDLLSADASLGSGPMAGAPGQVPPVLTASGLIIRPTSGDDLVATTPKTVDRWTSLWRMHPGDTILTVAAFGDVVVATTSRRDLVGYSDAGVRLWSLSLDDVAFRAPVRVDDRRIAVGDASGAVRVVDLLTGQQIWQQQLNAQHSAQLIGDPRAVIVLDAGGRTTAFAATSGERVWSTEVSGTLGAVLGGVVVIRNAATLEGLDLQTGRHRWLLPQTGTLDALQRFGDTLIAASQIGTLVIDERGTIRARMPAYEWVTVVGDIMVGWGGTEAEFRDAELAVLATIDTPDLTVTSTMQPPLAYRQGVVLFGRSWTFTSWSDEP